MHTNSQPPGDRNESPSTATKTIPPHDAELIRRIEEIKPLWKSHAKLGQKLGYTPAVITQWLGGKYPGKVDQVEARVRDYLLNEQRRRLSGVDTIGCEISRELTSAVELARKTNDIGGIIGEPGVGKTRGIDLFCEGDEEKGIPGNPLAMLFRTTVWRADKDSVESAMMQIVGWTGYNNRVKRAEFLCEKLAGSDRPLLVDDAHKLMPLSLQWFFDFQDATGIPLIFIGGYLLEDKLRADPQRFSRVGFWKELRPEDPEALILHLVTTLAPGCVNGERDDLMGLCRQVSDNHGHFRSVFKQLKHAGEIKASLPAESWPKCFRAAHTRLLRDYKLK